MIFSAETGLLQLCHPLSTAVFKEAVVSLTWVDGCEGNAGLHTEKDVIAACDALWNLNEFVYEVCTVKRVVD
jgi:hypothetical protein